MGFHGHLKPDADIYIILLKDMLGLLAHSFFLNLLVSKKYFYKKFVMKMLFIISIIFLISITHILRVGYWEWGQHYFRNIIYYLPFVIYGYVINNENGILFINKLIYYFISLCLLFSFYQLFVDTRYLFDERVISIVGDPNTLSLILGLGIVWTVLNKSGILMWSYLIFSLYLIDATASITGVFALALGGTTLFVLSTKYLKYDDSVYVSRMFFKVICLAFLVFSLNSVAFNAGFSKSSSFVKIWRIIEGIDARGFNKVSTVSGRISSIKKILTLKRSEILLGVQSPNYYIKSDNTITVILLNYGLIVLCMYIFPILYLIKKVKKMRNLYRSEQFFILSVTFYIISYYVLGLFNSVIYRFPINILYYIFIGSSYSVLSNKRSLIRVT